MMYNDIMGSLEIVPLTNDSNIKELMFENKDSTFKYYLNNNVALYHQVMNMASTKLIYIDNKLIGFYTLRSVVIESFDEDDHDSNEYGCVEVKSLYLTSKVRGLNVGKFILSHIITEAKMVNEIIGIRFVILDSVRDRHDWYKQRGFEYVDEERLKSEDTTIKMYYDLRDDIEVEKYFEE